MKEIKKVAVIGGGLMGTQIAIVAAKNAGNDVAVYDNNPKAFEGTRKLAEGFLTGQVASGKITAETKARVLEKISFHTDLGSALKETDLVIEAVPEELELKRKVFAELDRMAPASAILATNSSSIPISRIEDVTSRRDRVLNIHFYLPIEKINIVDLAKGTETSEAIFRAAAEWVKKSGCVSLKVNKEIIGFCFNRVWHSARLEALKMWAGGFVDFMDIDRAWMIFSGMPMGPFAMMDAIGLDVVYQVHMTYYNEDKDPFYKPPEALRQMVERGELGMKTGKGFYTYPNAPYSRPDFIKP